MVGTIGGRPANLWVAAAAAIYNIAVVFHLFGFDPTVDQNATVNVAIIALVALFANAAGNEVARVKSVNLKRRRTDTTIDSANLPPHA